MKRIMVVLLVAAGIVPQICAGQLKAGFSKINVTPTEAMGFSGHGGRWAKKPDKPRRFFMDLFIRATVIEDENGRKIALLTYDQTHLHLPLFMDIRKWAKEKYDIAPGALIMNYSHTHNGPLWWKTEDPVQYRYFKLIERETKHAIDLAVADLKPVEIKFGIMKAPTFMGNRAYYDKDVKKYRFMTYPNGSVDPDVPIFAYYRNGKLASLSYSFGAHATGHLYEEKNKRIKGPYTKGGEIIGSSDFPGFVARELRKVYGENAIINFFQGAGGDMSYLGTMEMVHTPKARYRKWRLKASLDGTEKIIAKRIVDFISSDNMQKVTNINFKSATGTFYIPYDCDPKDMPTLKYWQDLAAKAPDPSNAKTAYGIWYASFYDKNGKLLGRPWYMSLIEVNKDLQIIATAGEVCHGLSLALKKAYPDIKTVFYAYTYFTGGYIVDDSLVGSGCYQEKSNHAMPYSKESGKRGRPLFKKGINKVLLDAVAELRREAK